jgi:hypothetical protein
MMIAMASPISEAEILADVIGPASAGWSPDVARSLLELNFNAATTRRIRALLQKHNAGTISAHERLTLEQYLRVGQFLDLLHAKAKLSLQRAG